MATEGGTGQVGGAAEVSSSANLSSNEARVAKSTVTEAVAGDDSQASAADKSPTERPLRNLAMQIVHASRTSTGNTLTEGLVEKCASATRQGADEPSLNAVLVACACGNTRLLGELELGGVTSPIAGPPPFLVACAYGEREMAEFLLKRGANPEEVWEGGVPFSFDAELGFAERTLCHTAVASCFANGHVDLAALLLSYGVPLPRECQERSDCAAGLAACLQGRVSSRGESGDGKRKGDELSVSWKDLALLRISPDWLGTRTQLITEVDLSYNQLSQLPDELLTGLPCLTVLNLLANQLELLPGTEAIAKCQRSVCAVQTVSVWAYACV